MRSTQVKKGITFGDRRKFSSQTSISGTQARYLTTLDKSRVPVTLPKLNFLEKPLEDDTVTTIPAFLPFRKKE